MNAITTGAWNYSAYNGYRHLASGLCCGLSSLAAGLAIGVAGDAGVRANAQKDIYVGVVLILIFAEALGLYGLIIAIILSNLSPTFVNWACLSYWLIYSNNKLITPYLLFSIFAFDT